MSVKWLIVDEVPDVVCVVSDDCTDTLEYRCGEMAAPMEDFEYAEALIAEAIEVLDGLLNRPGDEDSCPADDWLDNFKEEARSIFPDLAIEGDDIDEDEDEDD